MRRSRLAIALALHVLTCGMARAQSREGASLDATLGFGGVFRGTYRSPLGAAVDVLWSAPTKDHWRWGASWSGQAGLSNTDDCVMRLAEPWLGCLQATPLIVSIAASIGRDWNAGSGLSMRTYVGPSLVRVYRRDRNPYHWSSMGGVSGRIDLSAGGKHIDFVVSSRSAYAPALPRHARGTFAFGLGLRIH